jgi:3-oxoadipate enol-lactonase
MPYVRTRLGRWFFEERGGAGARAGAPAIVLWPSLLCDGGMWRGQVEPLSALGRVLVFDGPGHGKSETPPPFTLEDNADALVDALDELKVDQVVMVGLSWGGMVGMRLSLQHPKRVKGLALLDTSADAESRSRAVKYRVMISFAKRLGFPPSLMEAQITPLFFSERTLASRPELVERFVRAANGFSREGAARAAMAVVVRRTDILGKIDRIQVPTLVLCGADDRATEVVHSQRIAERIRGSRLAIIQGAGHLSALERPDAVNEQLVPFVKARF